MLNAVVQQLVHPVRVRKEQFPSSIQRVIDRIRVVGQDPIQKLLRIHRGGAVMDIGLVVHDRHLIIGWRFHHTGHLGDRQVSIVSDLRCAGRSLLGRNQDNAACGPCSVNRGRGIF